MDAAACCLHAWQHAGQRGSPRPAVEGAGEEVEEAVAVTAADAGTERGAIQRAARISRETETEAVYGRARDSLGLAEWLLH